MKMEYNLYKGQIKFMKLFTESLPLHSPHIYIKTCVHRAQSTKNGLQQESQWQNVWREEVEFQVGSPQNAHWLSLSVVLKSYFPVMSEQKNCTDGLIIV